MAFHSRQLPSALIALALLFSGCRTTHSPDSTGLPAVSFSIIAPDARTVSVTGSFNRWDANSHPLSGPDRLGQWTVTVLLPPGRYEYLFIINDVEWIADPEAPSVDNGLGGRNSIVTVTGGEDGGR